MRWSAAGGGGLGELHGEPTGAEIMPELPEQYYEIGLIIDHENEQVHARSPDLMRARARPGWIRNSVNAAASRQKFGRAAK